MEMSEEQIKKLINSLNDEDYDVRKYVEDILIKLDDQSIELLINALNHAKPEISVQSARILGRIGNKKALNPLLQSLKDKNPDFRRVVAQAISKIVDKNS